MLWIPSQILINGFKNFVLVLLERFQSSYLWKFLKIIFPFNILKAFQNKTLLSSFNNLLGCYWTSYGFKEGFGGMRYTKECK
jgi:hypothetical protein